MSELPPIHIPSAPPQPLCARLDTIIINGEAANCRSIADGYRRHTIYLAGPIAPSPLILISVASTH